MNGPRPMSFAAYADPERPAEPTPPAPQPVGLGDVWNPCGGYYAKHVCALRGCDTSKCKLNGRQKLTRCPHGAQAPYTLKGDAVYKQAQCGSCRANERPPEAP